MYEYQSMVCEMTGMDVANASVYDGGSGLAEAALMAVRITGNPRILISETVNPTYRDIVRTYCSSQDIDVLDIPMVDGMTDESALREMVSDEEAGVIVQSPNYFGIVEPAARLGSLVRKQSPEALYIVSTNMISLAILKPPSEADADVVISEGQGLGNHLSFGGPYLGVFAVKEQYTRKIPGRLVGATVDKNDNRGFVLVLKTREQDIRRERATSNICTNQGLNALAATIYMATLGKHGIRHVANLCTQKAHYLAERLAQIDGVRLPYRHPFFHEFVIELPIPAEQAIQEMMARDIFAGIDLSTKYPEQENRLMVAVTEKRTREELDAYVRSLEETISSVLAVST